MLKVRHFIRAIKAQNAKAFDICLNSGQFDDNDLREALVLSAFSGFDTAVETLTERMGRDLGFLTDTLDRAFDIASVKGHAGPQGILEGAGVDPSHEQDFPLYLSAVNNQGISAAYLVLHGADDDNLEYAMKSAFKRGHRQLATECMFLRQNMATPDAALRWAVKRNHQQFAEAAIQAGANPNQGNGTLLLETTQDGKLQMLLLLVKHGGDVLASGVDVFFEAVKRCKDAATYQVAKVLYDTAKTRDILLPEPIEDENQFRMPSYVHFGHFAVGAR
jgi:hypothetical protein